MAGYRSPAKIAYDTAPGVAATKLANLPYEAGTTILDPTTGLMVGQIDGSGNLTGLSAAQVAVAQPLGATLFIASDSIQAQSLDPPNAGFQCTTIKGSYFSSGSVKTTGVMNLYAENPCRMQFRAAHGLVTGDEVLLDEMPSNHPLASQRFIATVTAADMITIPVDATGMATVASGAAASDAMAYVDMSWGNYGPLSWMMHEAGYPFGSISYCMRPGATTAQLVGQVAAALSAATVFSHGILHIGRNDSTFDQTSLTSLRDLFLAKCGTIMVVLPYPDRGWTSPANDAAAAKIAAISAFWYSAQAQYPRIRVCDMYAGFSDPTAVNEGGNVNYISSDNVHPQANGAQIGGVQMFRTMFDTNTPRRAVARVGNTGALNLMTGGRFAGAAGTVGSGVTGTVATGWTIGGRSSANVAGGYVQVCQTPAVMRRNSTAYLAGDILDPGDGWWYLVKTAGTTAAALPAGYATAVMFDSTTGVTDGTANVFRIPKFTDSLDAIRHQFLNLQMTVDGGNEFISFFQSVALPGSVPIGASIRGQFDVSIAGGFVKYHHAKLSCNNVTPAQIACAHGLAPNNVLTVRPSQAMRPRTVQTPAVRVPTATITLEHRLTIGAPIDGAQVFISLPMAEKL